MKIKIFAVKSWSQMNKCECGGLRCHIYCHSKYIQVQVLLFCKTLSVAIRNILFKKLY